MENLPNMEAQPNDSTENTTQDPLKDVQNMKFEPSTNVFVSLIRKKTLPYIAILVILLSAILWTTVIRQNFTNTTIRENPITEPNIVKEDPKPDPWTLHENRQYEFGFKYPTEAEFIEENPFSLDPSSYTVRFLRFEQEDTDINEENLREGYIFRLIVNKIKAIQTPEELSAAKQTYFHSICPENIDISNVEKITVSGFDATTFTVENCNGTYKHTFVSRENKIFELSEFYKGDLGYKERYAASTKEMYDSFSLTNINEAKPSETWIEYEDLGAKISFKHPNMNYQCCNIEGPITLGKQKREKIIVFAKNGTTKGQDRPFNGFAVYLVKNITSGEFDKYIQDQKAALRDNYSVIIGRAPEGTEKEVVVGNKTGVLLEGYAWWGDMIFVMDSTNNKVVVIAKTEEYNNSFNNNFGEILSTFKFENKKR